MMILSVLLLTTFAAATNVWPPNSLGLTAAPPQNFDRLTYQKKFRRDSIPIPGSVSTIAQVPLVDRRTIFAQQQKHHQQSSKASPMINAMASTGRSMGIAKQNYLYDSTSSSSRSASYASSSQRPPRPVPVPPVDNDSFVYTNLTANAWTEFFFSEPGQLPFSRWQFAIPSGQSCTLQVTDAYCTGDRFQAVRLFSNNAEEVLFDTPAVPFDRIVAAQIRAGQSVNCTPFTTDADTAWNSPSWSKNQLTIAAGNYRLILKSLLAPYGSGGAFVKLNCAASPSPTPSSQTCSFGSSNIKFLNQKTAWNQAAAACTAAGLTQLPVTSGNINDALNVLFNCGGANSRAWVASFNGDTYQNSVGLFLHAGATMGSGGLSATPDATLLYNVMCQ